MEDKTNENPQGAGQERSNSGEYTQAGTYGQESQIYARNNYRAPQSNGQSSDYEAQPGDNQLNYGGQPGSGNQQNGSQLGNNQQPNYGGQPGYNQQPNYGGQPGYNQQPNYGGQPGYNQQPNYGGQGYNQNYNQQSNYYNNGGFGNQVQHGPVNDLFCYILLAIMPLQIILGFISVGLYTRALGYIGQDASYFADMMLSRTYVVSAIFVSLLTILFIVFIIMDIVKISQQKYKITGLILFAIFFRPGYYIWRAHILGRKKTVPIIYTVAFSLLIIAYFVFVFYQCYLMALGMMRFMY